MIRRGKRGISPVVATVLLIVIALAIAAIIFVWAKAFFVEKVTKFGSDIDQACGDVQFSGEISSTDGKVNIENQGNVVLYGVKLIRVGEGSTEEVQTIIKTITSGQSATADLDSGILQYEEILIVPILYGEASGGNQEYVCDSSLGQQVTVA